ncbi:MAG TPA: PucR family transcriptional regulator ligand-binding domain-containing protein [Actinomycetota bacterium]|nr:PucR family transcriptional regulator ligand-binding domain-containing protein [Actinomycetota bacterium]
MALTVADILRMPGLSLRLVGGRKGLHRTPVRWAHVSELEDPSEWLKGGELLLTTGMGIGRTPARQRAYVKKLADARLAGLGFGLGFSHTKVPKAIVDQADALGFPVFEVPYEVPFIAITEAVFTQVVGGQFDFLQKASEAQNAMTRAVLDDKGVEGIADELANAIKGWALLLDLHGRPVAATGRAAKQRAERVWEELRQSRPEGSGFSLTLVDQGHHVWIQPVSPHGRVEAFLAIGKPEPLAQLDRAVASRALALFAIETAKARAVAEAERRLRGDFFDSLASGQLSASEAAKGLARFGLKGETRVISIEGGDPEELARAAEDVLSRIDGGFLISPHANGVHALVADPAARELDRLRKELEARVDTPVRIGAGSPAAAIDVGRSLREARYALQVCRLEHWETAGFEDLGTYRLLLSMVEGDVLRAYADSLLAPLDAYDAGHGGELLQSLRAFLEHNARWETAAAELYVHRHTLRYRIRKIEELTGRDLSNSFDRMEFWLALRARELMAADGQ